MSFIDELKRRNVFKVGAAYLALGWVVIQVTATLTPAFNLPASALPLVTWIGVIGFPCVVLFSWLYELTPEGLRREVEVDRSQSITHVTGRRLDYTIIALMLVAIALFAAREFMPARDAPVGAGLARDDQEVVGAAPARDDQEVVGAGLARDDRQAAHSPDPKSIAVLPFVDMSAAKDQEYMSDGIAEELLNLLARVPELRVAARTSAFSFKGQNLEIPEIAKRLHVANVLEGSVRKSGNRVRITAQLIQAADGYHLWSQTWDRDLDDIFAVQDEIAGAVVKELKVALLGDAPKTLAIDPQAYGLFLQARELGRLFTPEAWERSTALLKQVLELEPGYAPAWERMATNYINQTDSGFSVEEGYRLAREATERALALDPELPAGHDSLGWIAMFYDADLAAAARHYQHALELQPGNVDILGNVSRLLFALGRLDQGIALEEYVAANDPVSSLSHSNLAGSYLRVGRFDEGLASARTGLALSPGRLGGPSLLGQALLRKGDAAAALVEMQREPNDIDRLNGMAMVLHSLGRNDESDAALAELVARGAQEHAYRIAGVHAWRGEVERSFEWLEKARTQRGSGMTTIASDRPLAAVLGADPRWMPFLQSIGRAPEQLAMIPVALKLPGNAP